MCGDIMYGVMIILSKFVCVLPLKLRMWIGNLIGNLTWLLVPKKRKIMAMRNIQLSLNTTPQETQIIAKASWTRFGRMIMDVLAIPILPKEIKQRVRFIGIENMDKALVDGNGVVLATSHSGNWEMLGAALATSGYPLVGVAQKQANLAMDRFINEYRTLSGMHVTYKSGVREMIRLMGQGMIIGILMDQDAAEDGVILPFFHREASCPQGTAFLARMKKAPIVPTFITEDKDGYYTITCQAPVYVEETNDKTKDIIRTIQLLNMIIESHIRKHPEEWFWLHNRWKYTEETLKNKVDLI